MSFLSGLSGYSTDNSVVVSVPTSYSIELAVLLGDSSLQQPLRLRSLSSFSSGSVRVRIELLANLPKDTNMHMTESPRWLLKKHRYRDSYKSFCRLRNSEVQAARDLVSFGFIDPKR